MGQAALRMAKQIVREILDKGDDPLRHVQTFESLWVRSGYAKDIQTLGTIECVAQKRVRPVCLRISTFVCPRIFTRTQESYGRIGVVCSATVSHSPCCLI